MGKIAHQTVITYASPNDYRIDLTRAQIQRFRAAGKWPKDPTGAEMCTVHHGEHIGVPTFSDTEILLAL